MAACESEVAAVGHNRISKVVGGCGLLGQWTNASGRTGVSLNTYDPANRRWHQYWVGGDGVRFRLEGGLQVDAMVMMGRHGGDAGPVLDRVRWTPLAAWNSFGTAPRPAEHRGQSSFGAFSSARTPPEPRPMRRGAAEENPGP